MEDSLGPAISVIIPAYNQASFLPEAIRSVFNQTFSNFELIVIDDGLTDETPNVLATFNNPRLRVIRQPNGGLSAARNTGLRESTAPLVTFLDSDDLFLPEKLALLTAYLNERPEIGLVAGGVKYIDQEGHFLTEKTDEAADFGISDLLFENPICVSGI